MSIFSASNEIGKIFYGSNEIGKVYYGSTLIWEAVKPIVETDPELITTTTTKTLEAGTYKAIVIGAGGGGNIGSNVASSRDYVRYGGGGGGSGYVTINTFILTANTSITFTVGTGGAAIDGGESSVKGTGVSIVASGGKTGTGSASKVSGQGDGGSGGGSGGRARRKSSSVISSGGAGGYGGHDGYGPTTGLTPGYGVNGTSQGGSANNGGSSGATPGPGNGGAGAKSLQTTLLTRSGFDAATVNSILAAMQGGGGGGGGSNSTYTSASAGGGGGGWEDGAKTTGSISTGGAIYTPGGVGGNGAILWRRLA